MNVKKSGVLRQFALAGSACGIVGVILVGTPHPTTLLVVLLLAVVLALFSQRLNP